MKCSVERYSEKCKVIHQQINDILMCSNHLRSVSTVYTFMYHWNHQLFKFFLVHSRFFPSSHCIIVCKFIFIHKLRFENCIWCLIYESSHKMVHNLCPMTMMWYCPVDGHRKEAFFCIAAIFQHDCWGYNRRKV